MGVVALAGLKIDKLDFNNKGFRGITRAGQYETITSLKTKKNLEQSTLLLGRMNPWLGTRKTSLINLLPFLVLIAIVPLPFASTRSPFPSLIRDLIVVSMSQKMLSSPVLLVFFLLLMFGKHRTRAPPPFQLHENCKLSKCNTRKKTTNLAVAKRGKEKVTVPVFDVKFCGYFKHEDNFQLTYDKIDDMPEQKIARVIQNVRDHFILVPDDDVAVKAIKNVMRDAYKAYMHKLYLKYKEVGGDGFAASDGHLKALAHPLENCPNKHGWAHMCNHFTTDQFKTNSERGCRAAAAKQQNGINHSNDNKSFASTEYDLLQVGQPCDPVTFFRRTHDPENKINAKCKEMSEKMKAMKEAADLGETIDTQEEIFNKFRNAGCAGKRRRKAHPTNYIRMASLEQENKWLNKETGPKATKKLLKEYLVKVGITSMELSSEDDVEDDDDDDDEDSDMHESQIHEHRDAFEGSDRKAEEEDEAFRDDQEEGDEENRDKELEKDCEEE
ncbi:hypothetical protein MKX03_025125 [Papaver bracteatum]|nr:hypothetical protein MKX03_025125 [Papaver bracteatum]